MQLIVLVVNYVIYFNGKRYKIVGRGLHSKKIGCKIATTFFSSVTFPSIDTYTHKHILRVHILCKYIYCPNASFYLYTYKQHIFICLYIVAWCFMAVFCFFLFIYRSFNNNLMSNAKVGGNSINTVKNTLTHSCTYTLYKKSPLYKCDGTMSTNTTHFYNTGSWEWIWWAWLSCDF
jgi:hypothetical protein